MNKITCPKCGNQQKVIKNKTSKPRQCSKCKQYFPVIPKWWQRLLKVQVKQHKARGSREDAIKRIWGLSYWFVLPNGRAFNYLPVYDPEHFIDEE